MRIEIRGDKLKITDSIKSQIEEKLGTTIIDVAIKNNTGIKEYELINLD